MQTAALLFAAIVISTPTDIRWTHDVRPQCAVDTACTDFEALVLYCGCVQQGREWAPKARITGTVEIYLSNQEFLIHELMHVVDFRRFLRRYGEAVESRRFGLRADCEAFAAHARVHFTDVLREAQRESMLQRDHSDVGAPSDRRISTPSRRR